MQLPSSSLTKALPHQWGPPDPQERPQLEYGHCLCGLSCTHNAQSTHGQSKQLKYNSSQGTETPHWAQAAGRASLPALHEQPKKRRLRAQGQLQEPPISAQAQAEQQLHPWDHCKRGLQKRRGGDKRNGSTPLDSPGPQTPSLPLLYLSSSSQQKPKLKLS